MPNEETKPWKIVDYIDRFEVLDILDRMAGWYAEPPVDLKELELVHEIKFKIKQLQSIDAKEVQHGHWAKNQDGTFSGIMGRYIDADELIAGGWHLERHAPNGRCLTMMSIADVPTADVEEVKHAEWIYSKTYYTADECNCSLCGQLMTTASNVRMNYCPNCGAKMDGGKAE